MGNKYEVYEWWRDFTKGEDYKYHLEWRGDSFFMALFVMIKLKLNGASYVMLKWR
jgi:hypothetical protein